MPIEKLTARLSEAQARIIELEGEIARLRPEPGRGLPSPSVILESITDGFVAIDREFRYVWVNAEAEKLIGLSRGCLLGYSIWELFPLTVGSALETNLRRALAERVPVEFENFYAPRDRWFFNKAYPTKDGGLAIYWRDITARKRAEAETRRQSLVLQQVHDSIISTDLAGRITSWNHGAERIFGYRAKEVLGDSVAMLYFPEDRNQVASRVLGPLLHAGQLEVELRNRRKSGEECFIRLSLTILRDEKDQPYGMLGVALDITEQKRARKALLESEERYRNLANAMPQIAYTTDAEGRTQFINQHWSEYAGIATEACFALDWIAWIHPDDAPALHARWMVCVEKGEPFDMEYRVRNREGQYRIHLSRAVPMRNAEGRITQWVGTLTDIHDLRSAEAAQRLNKERLLLAINAIEAVVYDWDLQTGVVQIKGDLDALIGITPSQGIILHEWWMTRVHPDDLPEIQRRIKTSIETGQDRLHAEYRAQHALGHWVHICDHCFIVRDAAGVALRMVGSGFDISSRKELEHNLALQANILATISDAVIAIGQNKRIRYANTAAERMFGFTAAEIVGKPLAEIESRWKAETVSSTITTLPPETGGGMVAIIRDISERKQAER